MQYFDNVRHNLTPPDGFVLVMKLTIHIEQWDAEIAWYSPDLPL